MLWLMTLAGALLGSGLVTLDKDPLPPAHRLSPTLLIVLFALMAVSVTSLRMAPLFLVGAAPLWIPQAAHTVETVLRRVSPKARRAAGTLVITTLIFAVFLSCAFDKIHVFGIGLRKDRVPEAATAALDRSGRARRIYNAYNYGGYLMIARHMPSDGVFVDGRAVTLYSPEFLRAFAAAYEDPAIFEQLVEKYHCDSVLLPVKSARTPRLLRYLDHSPKWQCLYRDAEAAAYIERNLETTAP
jgi:hypothetical protein